MQFSFSTSTRLFSAGMALSLACLNASGAEQITGTINVKLNLLSSCMINDVEKQSGAAVELGDIDFGTHTAFFKEASADLLGSAGAGIAIQCTKGNAPKLTFDNGRHEDGGERRMANGTTYVGYKLFQDKVGGTPISGDGNIITLAADGSKQHVNIAAQALGAAGLIAGSYEDQVGVTLEF